MKVMPVLLKVQCIFLVMTSKRGIAKFQSSVSV